MVDPVHVPIALRRRGSVGAVKKAIDRGLDDVLIWSPGLLCSSSGFGMGEEDLD